MEIVGRGAIALGLFGPPLVGVVALIASFAKLRRRDVSRPAAAIALVVWVAVCIATAWLFVMIGFGYTWGWAHGGRPVPIAEQATLLGIICAGLALLSGIGALLYRLVGARRWR